MSQCYFKIRNFENFQHYSKRNPPWIRLYYRLLHDRNFYRLSVSAKYTYIGILLIASQCENKIDADPDWLAKELSFEITPNDWQLLINAQFIIPIDCDAIALIARLTKTHSHSITEVITDNSEVITEILSFSPKTQKASIREAIEILNYWNKLPAVMHHRSLNGQEKAIARALKKFSPEEIRQAIERYSIVKQNSSGKYRNLYQWTLGEFLSRKDHFNVDRFNAEDWEQPFLAMENGISKLEDKSFLFPEDLKYVK